MAGWMKGINKEFSLFSIHSRYRLTKVMQIGRGISRRMEERKGTKERQITFFRGGELVFDKFSGGCQRRFVRDVERDEV